MNIDPYMRIRIYRQFRPRSYILLWLICNDFILRFDECLAIPLIKIMINYNIMSCSIYCDHTHIHISNDIDNGKQIGVPNMNKFMNRYRNE